MERGKRVFTRRASVGVFALMSKQIKADPRGQYFEYLTLTRVWSCRRFCPDGETLQGPFVVGGRG